MKTREMIACAICLIFFAPLAAQESPLNNGRLKGTLRVDTDATTQISPSQITSDQNNYNPTGLATAQLVRLTSDTARSITGLAAQTAGRRITLRNVNASGIISLTAESSSSTAANRFSAGATIGPGEEIVLTYDGTALRWIVSGASQAALDLKTNAADIGVTIQAYDATLAALAGYNTNGILVQTAADTFVGRTITGTTGQITVTNGSGVSGNPTLSLPSALTGINSITSAAATDLTLSAQGTGKSVIITSSGNLRRLTIDKYTTAPASNQLSGNNVGVTYDGGNFTPASGSFAGVPVWDAILGWYYNPDAVTTDVQWGQSFESRYANATSGVSSEWYLAWRSQFSGANYISRRPIQFNVNHTDSGDGTRDPGSVDVNLSAEYFSIASSTGITANSSGGVLNGARTFTWNGRTNAFSTTGAGHFDGALDVDGILTVDGTGTSTFGGQIDSSGTLVRVGVGTTAPSRWEQFASGGQAITLFRGLTQERVRLGASAGESAFGSVGNIFALDIIGNTTLRDLLFRQSANDGSTFTNVGRIASSGRWVIGSGSDDGVYGLQATTGIAAYSASLIKTASQQATPLTLNFNDQSFIVLANLSGNNPGIWLHNSTISGSNYALQGNATSTQFNVASGGTLRFRVANGDKFTVNGTTVAFGGSLLTTFDDTTEATTSTGSIKTLGGILSTKKLITLSTITTAANVAWDLGAYTAGAPTPDGYLTVIVAGTTYRVSADLQP